MSAISNISSLSSVGGGACAASLDVARNAQDSNLKTDYASSIVTCGGSPFLPENAAEMQASVSTQASSSAGKANQPAANDSKPSMAATADGGSKGTDWMDNIKSLFDNIIKAVADVGSFLTKLVSTGAKLGTKLIG